jgi:hypothetical protein
MFAATIYFKKHYISYLEMNIRALYSSHYQLSRKKMELDSGYFDFGFWIADFGLKVTII